MVKHPGCKRLKYLLKDEIKAAKEYGRYGYRRLSRQERSHHKFLMKIYKKKCKG